MEESEKMYKLRYLVMPDYIYQDDDLTSIALKIYCFIHSYTGEEFFFSNEHLSKMFKCSGKSITRAISLLEKKMYIMVDYKIKSDGGKVRFVTDLFNRIDSRTDKNVCSEGTKMSVPKGQKCPDKDNNKKIITKSKEKNLIKKEREYSTPESLTDIDFQEIAERYRVPIAFVLSKHEDMVLWHGQNPRKNHKSNWRLTLMNWVKRDSYKLAKEAYAASKRHVVIS